MTNLNRMNNRGGREAKEIDPKAILNVLKKRFWIILILAILTGLAGYFYGSSSKTLLYQSSTRIIVNADAELMKTLQVIIKDSTVLEKVINELQIDRSPEALASQITVESVSASQVVSINVVDTNPELAMEIANTTAKIFKEEIPKIIEFNNVRFLSDAKLNPNPINETNPNRTIMIAIVAGFIIGVGLVFLLDSFDETIKSEREIEELLEMPVIGRIAKINKNNLKKKNQKLIEINLRGETSVSK